MGFLGFFFSVIIIISAIAPTYGKTPRFRLWYQIIEIILFSLGVIGFIFTSYFEMQAAHGISDVASREWVQDSFATATKLLFGISIGVALLTILSMVVTPRTMVIVKKVLPAATAVILLILSAVFVTLSENDTMPKLPEYIFASALCSSLFMHLPYFLLSLFDIHSLPKKHKK